MNGLLRLLFFSTTIFLPTLLTQAGFSSIHVFGDGVSSMTDGPGGSFYYGNRYSNGRVWVEVLAQRQGLVCETSNNISFYGNYSSNLVAALGGFTPPSDPSNALYVVWVCNADFVAFIRDLSTDSANWTKAVNLSLSNHLTIITNLYFAKGARTLVMPNAVDLGKVPFYQSYGASQKAFIRQYTTNFNSQLAALIEDTVASLPGLKIYNPDLFGLLDDIADNPAMYGLIKPNTCVIGDLPPSQWALNGPGTNYLYWDDLDPTAKAHAEIADYIQNQISPVTIKGVTRSAGTNWLQIANVPIGRNGVVESCTNLNSWTAAAEFTSSNVTQFVQLPVTAPLQFYRLRFPFSWTWP